MASIVKYSITGSSLAPTTQASGVTGSSIANGSLSSFGAGNDGWALSSSYAVDMDNIDFTGDVADLSVIAGITGIAYASAKTVNGVLLGATGNVKGWNGNT